MFEVGTAEHLELCLMEEYLAGAVGFGKVPIAMVQQAMTRGEFTGSLHTMKAMERMHPEVHNFLVAYCDGLLPRYMPLGGGRTSADMPRDATGRFLNIPIRLDA